MGTLLHYKGEEGPVTSDWQVLVSIGIAVKVTQRERTVGADSSPSQHPEATVLLARDPKSPQLPSSCRF